MTYCATHGHALPWCGHEASIPPTTLLELIDPDEEPLP